MELIKLDNLTKTYHVGEMDVPVLKGVTLRVGAASWSLSSAHPAQAKAR